MNWYGSGYIIIINYAAGADAGGDESFDILTETSLDLMTETSVNLLTEAAP